MSLIRHTDAVYTTTCVSNLKDARAICYLGTNQGDSLDVPAPCFVPKSELANYVLAPMLKNDAMALKLPFNAHSLTDKYNFGRNFIWPNNKPIKRFFPNRTNKKIVLTDIPNAIAVAYGPTHLATKCRMLSAHSLNLNRNYIYSHSSTRLPRSRTTATNRGTSVSQAKITTADSSPISLPISLQPSADKTISYLTLASSTTIQPP